MKRCEPNSALILRLRNGYRAFPRKDIHKDSDSAILILNMRLPPAAFL